MRTIAPGETPITGDLFTYFPARHPLVESARQRMLAMTRWQVC